MSEIIDLYLLATFDSHTIQFSDKDELREQRKRQKSHFKFISNVIHLFFIKMIASTYLSFRKWHHNLQHPAAGLYLFCVEKVYMRRTHQNKNEYKNETMFD